MNLSLHDVEQDSLSTCNKNPNIHFKNRNLEYLDRKKRFSCRVGLRKFQSKMLLAKYISLFNDSMKRA